MRNIHLRFLLSAMCVASVLMGSAQVNAAPIRFDQVVQVLNSRPEKATTSSFAQLRVAGDFSFLIDDDDEKKTKTQDGRVITETKSDIVKDDVCDCEEPSHEKRRFPKWALLGLAAIPIAFIIIKDDDDKTPTPTPSGTVPPSPSQTQTPPPSMTPTPMTPPPSPTPHEPVPEPITILLFGTGLASIGVAARRKYGKRDNGDGGK
jgi:hypothetical protein